MAFQDRIVDFQRIRAADLQDNQGNWRTHPAMQREALTSILEDIGIADVLLAYHSERHGGKLTLIDGHLRRSIDEDQQWPTVILDLTDEEADLILSTLDPLAGMAGIDPQKLQELLERTVPMTESLAVQEVFRNLKASTEELLAEMAQKQADEDAGAASDEIPEMDLLPFEHYDYLVLIFKNSLDFESAIEYFGIGKARYVATSLKGKAAAKIGAARVLDGAKALEALWTHQPELPDLDLPDES